MDASQPRSAALFFTHSSPEAVHLTLHHHDTLCLPPGCAAPLEAVRKLLTMPQYSRVVDDLVPILAWDRHRDVDRQVGPGGPGAE